MVLLTPCKENEMGFWSFLFPRGLFLICVLWCCVRCQLQWAAGASVILLRGHTTPCHADPYWACLFPACGSTSVRHHHHHAMLSSFHLITISDMSLLLPQTKTCQLLSSTSDSADGSDSAAMGQVPGSLTESPPLCEMYLESWEMFLLL